jgi:DnaJ-class molecular chaperone
MVCGAGDVLTAAGAGEWARRTAASSLAGVSSARRGGRRRHPACNGTGFPTVMQPVKPSHKIYPIQCKNCGGKGRIAGAAN